MAGFSFLSALSVVTTPSQPYFPLAKFERSNVSESVFHVLAFDLEPLDGVATCCSFTTRARIRCHYIMEESDVANRMQHQQLNRRDILKCFTSVVGLLAVMSAFLGSDQLAIENKLATDPKVRPWVEKYQRSRETVSQTDYEVDLITTLTKLSSLGQQVNYEAYTYPVQKIQLGKLKL